MVFLENGTIRKERHRVNTELIEGRRGALQRNTEIATLYISKVMHILYPDHFPKIYSQGWELDEEGRRVFVSRHEYIPLDELADRMRKKMLGNESEDQDVFLEYDRWAASDTGVADIRVLKQKYGLNIDDSVINFAKSSRTGTTYYIDEISHKYLRDVNGPYAKIDVIRFDILHSQMSIKKKLVCLWFLKRYGISIQKIKKLHS